MCFIDILLHFLPSKSSRHPSVFSSRIHLSLCGFVHAFIFSSVQLFIFICSSARLLIYSSTQLFSYSAIQPFSHSSIQPFSHSAIQLFRYSFVHLFIYPSPSCTSLHCRSSPNKLLTRCHNDRKAPAPTTQAWGRGSTNPLTQRVSSPVVQNGASPTSNVAKPQPASTSAKDAKPSHQTANHRLLFLLANFKGLNATFLLKNGDRISGIFSGIDGEQYSLKMAKRLPSRGSQTNGASTKEEHDGHGEDRTMHFHVHDVVDLSVENARFDKLHTRAPNGRLRSLENFHSLVQLTLYRRSFEFPYRHGHFLRLPWSRTATGTVGAFKCCPRH